MRAFHNQAMMKQKIYKNILARRSGVDYSPGIHFQTSLVDMDEAKSLTKKNELEKRIISKEDGAGVAPSRTYELPQMTSLWGFLIEKPKIGLGDGVISI